MRTLGFLLIGCLLVLAGCHVRDFGYCQGEKYKCHDGSTCVDNRCVPDEIGDGGDGGEDLAVGDLATNGDGPRLPDGGGDLARECDASVECGNLSQAVCTAVGQCRGCRSGDDSQCAEHAGVPYCEADAGRCVECTAAAATCPSPKPICDANACRTCGNDDECATGICLANGSCAAAADVVFVDNHGDSATDCKNLDGGAPDGSRARPFCTIQDGIDAGKLFVRVAGHSAASYDSIAVTTNKTVTVVGPLTGGEPAIIFSTSPSNSNVKLQVGSGNASLTLVRMQVGDPTMASTQDNVFCNGSGATTVALTMLNSASVKSGMHGVNAINCKLTLDANQIAFNGGGGVVISQTSKYSLTNNFIYRNTGAPALSIDPTASGVFQFNTVANNNKLTAGIGGIDCGSTAQPIEASIFWNNLPTEQFGCALINDDVDTTNPMFVNEASDNYKIAAPSLINMITGPLDGGASTLPDHDFYGTHRPAHGGYDVGAYEVR